MAMKGFTRNFKPLEILTAEQVEAIHRGALDVLRETGVRIEHKTALKLLEKNGCKVDHDEMRARFPEALVEECLRKCPSSFRLKARNPKNDVTLGENNVYFRPFPGMQTVDIDSWEPRTPTKQEYIDGIKVLDALDNVSGFGNYTPYFGFEGVPPVMAIPEGLALRLANSSKTFSEGNTMDCVIFNIELAKAVDCEFAGNVAGSAPLTYYSDPIESLFKCAEAGFPIFGSGGGHVMGGTGPATFAGSLVLDLAQNAPLIVLAQLVNPGTRVILGDFTFPLNMRTGSPAFGDIGVSLHTVARSQFARKYGIPTVSMSSGPSSSKQIDFQCGYEKAIKVLSAAISGSDIVALHGAISSELTHHPVQAILDDDIAGMVGRFLEGIEVNDETLALDLIKEVGPIPGNYLNKEHTRKWWKKEQFMPKVADRLTYPEWINAGKKGALDYAKERMEEILSTHKVDPPLPKSQEEEIARILEEARNFYKNKGLISEEEWSAYKKCLE